MHFQGRYNKKKDNIEHDKKTPDQLYKMAKKEIQTENINSIPFESINNKHKDKRCFILGTGPTLDQVDLTKLDGEITFGLNSISNAYIPKYWVAISNGAFLPHSNAPLLFQSEILFIDVFCLKHLKDASNDIGYSYQEQYDKLFFFISGNFEFQTKIDSEVVPILNGGSVLFPAIQLAFIMGCNPIYLVGICYKNYKQNYYSKSKKLKNLCEFAELAGVRAMKKCKEVCDNNKKDIISATPNNLFVDRKIIDIVEYESLFRGK